MRQGGSIGDPALIVNREKPSPLNNKCTEARRSQKCRFKTLRKRSILLALHTVKESASRCLQVRDAEDARIE